MKKNFRLIFRIIWTIVALIATFLTLKDHLTVLGGDNRPVTLFFTSWSVWLGALAAVLSLISTIKDDAKSPQINILIKFCADMMLIATFVMSALVLPEKIWMSSYWTAGGTFKHFLLPIFTVTDSILYDEKNSYKISYPFLALVVPFFYWAGVIIRALVTRKLNGGSIPQDLWQMYYPYGFTNFDNGHSLGGLCGLLAGIMVALIIIGYSFYFAKKYSKK